jgi:hypothetical protein
LAEDEKSGRNEGNGIIRSYMERSTAQTILFPRRRKREAKQRDGMLRNSRLMIQRGKGMGLEREREGRR